MDEKAAFTHFFQLLKEFRSRDKSKDIDPVLLEDSLKSHEKVA